MGTWDATAFGNDAAADFAADLVEAGDIARIAEALRAAADTEDYLEAPESQQALAAAEIVAAMTGRATGDLPEDVASWAVERGPADADLTALARRAVERIASDSELKELWEEADASEWKAQVSDLRERLG